MAKFTPAYLKKLEDVLKETGYEVRYEKGNFRSNYCLLETKKVVVINKFSTLESRIQSLIEILTTLVDQGHVAVDLREAGIRRKIKHDHDGQTELTMTADDSVEVVNGEETAESNS